VHARHEAARVATAECPAAADDDDDDWGPFSPGTRA